MNVQIKVNGLGKVDFFLRHYGWVRDVQIELCGQDDADNCFEPVIAFLRGLSPQPFENVTENFVTAAEKDIENALEQYLMDGREVNYTDTINISIRPVPKSSRDSTPEEIAEFIKVNS